MMQSVVVDAVEVVNEVVDVADEVVDVVDEVVDEVPLGVPECVVGQNHRRAVIGNTKSREASGTAGGSRSLGQRPRSPAHALAW
jgi:hypothetical protein